MSFKKKKYTIIRQAISKDLAAFVANYFSMQKQVYDTCRQSRYFSPFENIIGHYESKNEQIPETYSQYSNIAMETLMLKCQPQMEKVTGLKLYPAYTYARIYKKGDELKRHKDRFSCEISTTMNLGGDDWPIYLEPNPKKGNTHNIVNDKKTKETRNKFEFLSSTKYDLLFFMKSYDVISWRLNFEKNNDKNIINNTR